MTGQMETLYLALIHHPVVNKRGKTVGSAVTNMDIHDIARAARTFGAKGYYLVTPYEDQAELAGQIMDHWTKGAGGKVNPCRKEALEMVRVVPSLEAACEDIETQTAGPVTRVATSANAHDRAVRCSVLKERLDRSPHVLIFGTAWGLTEELIGQCEMILEPIQGKGSYNHLSVRSAASIYLDRLTNG